MKRSLSRKFLYSFLVVTVLILAGVSVAISVLLREYYIHNKERDLLHKGEELGQVVAGYNAGGMSYAQLANYLNVIDTFIDARVWVVDASHKIVAVSNPRRDMPRGGQDMPGAPMLQPNAGTGFPQATGMGMRPGGQATAMIMHLLATELKPAFAGQTVQMVVYNQIYKENMVVVAVPMWREDGSVSGAVILNAPVRGINRFLHDIYFYIAGIGLLALVVAFLLVRKLSRGIVGPLKGMQESAAAMACGDYSIRVPVNSGDEVGELGKSLNTLAQELDRFVSNTNKAEKLRRDFVANVSHELRTPLTIIRGYTEALLDGTVTELNQAEKFHRLMRDETVRLEGLIRELLDLSRLQADNAQLEMETIPLAAIAESVMTLVKQKAEQKSVALTLQATTGAAEIRGNGDRLTQLILIFLDNALKFTPAGGTIAVGIDHLPKIVVLTVQDSGKGIAADDLPFIWERFYKADKSHTRDGAGTGLGLAIAREIIERHGAKVEVNSRMGEGTTFRIEFPAA
jgi:signal transduction histidine kinase